MEENNNIPGKGAATASLVLGIISVVLWFFGYSALVSVILGIVGLIGGAIFFVACVACVGAIGAADATGAFDDLFSNM